MAKTESDEFRSIMDELIAAVDEFRLVMTGATQDEIDRAKQVRLGAEMARESVQKNTKATNDNTKAKNESSKAFKQVENIVKAAGREFINIGDAGTKLAQQLGVGAVRGVQLEIDNRKVLAAQLLNFNSELAVTMEQLKAAQTSFAQTFVGVSEGMQVSARGSRQFAEDLKKGFGAEFEATPATFRMLIDMGMSNVQQMQAFTKASGKAGFAGTQLATLYSKNTLSFMLYGNSFTRAAINAEKLGISLASVQSAQEGLVTNLDGTIDSVAQLNQLGAQLDFGTLIRVAETEGPEALLAYVRQVVPEQLMQSASTRALFKQLGISIEDYIRSGTRQTTAADQIQKKFEETATQVSDFAKTAQGASRVNQILKDVLGDLKAAIEGAIGELYNFIKALIAAGATAVANAALGGLRGGPPGTPAPGPAVKGLSALGKAGYVAAGLTTAAASAAYGRSLVEQGKTKTGIGLGALGGGLGLALALAPFTGGASLIAAGLIGAGVGGGYAALGMRNRQPTPVQDAMFPTGAKRVIIGPEGSFITSVRDSLVATATSAAQQRNIDLSKQQLLNTTRTSPIAYSIDNNTISGISLSSGNVTDTTRNYMTERLQRDTSELLRKVQSLIDTLATATTTVTINNNTQKIPRMQLVSVHSRNEVV